MEAPLEAAKEYARPFGKQARVRPLGQHLCVVLRPGEVPRVFASYALRESVRAQARGVPLHPDVVYVPGNEGVPMSQCRLFERR